MADIDLDEIESWLDDPDETVDNETARELLRRARELERWSATLAALKEWRQLKAVDPNAEFQLRCKMVNEFDAALRQEPKL